MKLLFTLSALLIVTATVVAQTTPGPVLENEDIDRFIDTYEQMDREFEQLDEQFDDEEEEDLTYAELLQSYKEIFIVGEAIEIIEKYGWDKETYGEKIIAISYGTMYLLSAKSIEQMPEEQQQMMQDDFLKPLAAYVHADDLKLLKTRLSDLEEVFNEM